MYLYHVSFITIKDNEYEITSDFITSTKELSTAADVHNFQKKVDELANSNQNIILSISLVSRSFKEL